MENVEIIWDSVVEEINGGEVVEKIQVKNLKSGENKELAVDGIFIAVGYNPSSEVYKEVLELAPGGYIKADESGITNVPGVFAAGDIRTKELRQIITAASDGANAVTGVEKYLNSL
jgi:thioredoxin reductase (NADPH)